MLPTRTNPGDPINTSHSSEEQTLLEKASKQNLIIWGALLASIGVYAASAIPLMEGKPDNPELGERLRTILGAVALATVLAGIFLRRVMLAIKKPLTSDPEAVFGLAAVRYRLWSAVSWSASLSAFLYGLALFLMGGNLEDLLAFGGLSLVAMFYNRPSAEALDAYIMAHKKLLPE